MFRAVFIILLVCPLTTSYVLKKREVETATTEQPTNDNSRCNNKTLEKLMIEVSLIDIQIYFENI
jgi:hypothetical protein